MIARHGNYAVPVERIIKRKEEREKEERRGKGEKRKGRERKEECEREVRFH
jgi:hypothetical protein